MILIIQHIAIEGPGMLEEVFTAQQIPFNVVHLYAGGRLPADLSTLKAVIVLGGPMNVYEEDKHPYLLEEDIFLKKVLEAGIPFLGICLGAQLLAKAAGGKVVKASQAEVGWFQVSLTEAGKREALFAGCANNLEVFQWHGDMVELPEGSSLLAESPVCPQAFRVGEVAYGLQFHIEVTPKMVMEWVHHYDYDPDGKGNEMIVGAHAKAGQLEKLTQKVITGFLQLLK